MMLRSNPFSSIRRYHRHIENNILKHYLRNCYFITGTAYAGKSTMCAMLAEKYDMLHYSENYGIHEMREVADPKLQPNLCYTKQMPSWEAFVIRTPEEYNAWIEGSACEVSQFQVLELIKMSAAGKKIIVDTNLTIEMLREISDYGHVAVMLSPQTISAERFFDRSDEDKQFLLSVIDGCPDPKWAEDNFRACIAKVNRPEIFEAFENSGFAVFKRDFSAGDTRQEMLDQLAKHFGLK